MILRVLSLALVFSLAIIALPAVPALAQTVSVVVDGQLMGFDQPPIMAGGRVLVPLRGVFEHLGATVLWNAATNVVTAQRADTQVQLAIGSRQAIVNGRVVTLDVPATIVGGRTLVPLRFVSEAMGAQVDWDNNTRVVTITSGTTALPVQPAPVQPAPAPQPAERIVTGRIDAITSRSIALSDGQIFTFADGVRFIVNGQEVTREQLRVGMEVRLRLNPQTSQVLVVQSRTQAGQPPVPPAAGNVQIVSFTHNATSPLRVGAPLTVTLRGTPGGTASFDIFGVISGVALRQVSSGVYQGVYTVRPQDNVAAATVVGRLRVNGQEASLVQAGTPVTLDGTAPQIVQRFPDRGQTMNNVRPNILITFNDAGSGIDPARSRLFVNGQNVTARVSITETALAYSPPDALTGRVLVRVILADRAGNVTQEEYAFTTAVPQTSLIRSVTVSPVTPLRPRDVLTVTMVGEPRGQASFTIEGVEDNIPMTEAAAQRGVYVGSYTIRPRERVAAQNARIIVRLSKGEVTSQADAARLIIVATEGVAPPVITSPAAGARMGAPIVIRGKATPGYRVEVQVDYQGALLVVGLKGTYGKITTTADAAGNWGVQINQMVRISNAELTITAVTIDPLGHRSEAVTTKATLARIWQERSGRSALQSIDSGRSM